MKNFIKIFKEKWVALIKSKNSNQDMSENKLHRWKRFGVDLTITILVSLLLVTLVECLNRQGVSAYLEWIDHSFRLWLLNWFVYSLFFFMFYFLPRKLFYGWIVFLFAFVSLIGLGNYVLMQFKGDPLTPLDFLLASEATNIVKGFQLGRLITIVAIVIAIFVAGSIYLISKMKKTRYSFLLKIIVSIVSVQLLVTLVDQYQGKTMNFVRVESKVSNPLRNTLQNGFLIHFALEMSAMKVEKPVKISKSELIEKLSSYKQIPEAEEKKPNIIIWMGEAFWDVTKSSKVKFSKDPLENFHKWENEYSSGNLLVKTIGGHTANTEFEVLTGSNMGFLPDGSVPYNQYVTKPMDSLAYTFTNNGYYATAIHPFRNWFYNRNKIYNKLGFDQFICGEFFTKPELVNNYISDKDHASAILSQLKKTEGQDFIYAVSMQNHSPYNTVEPYDDLKITGDISPHQKEVLEKYGRNLYDTDQALKDLVDGLEKSGEPTVLIVYGDHLPRLQSQLGFGNKDFQNLFPEDKTAYEKYLRSYETPLLIWNNIGLKKEKLNISTSYLGAYLLHELNQKRPIYWDYLYSQFQKNTKLPISEFYKDENINLVDLEFYKQLQYDRLFGEGNSFEYPVTPKPNYFLGLDPQKITDVKFLKNEGEFSIYQISGGGFVVDNFIKKPTDVYIDGEKVESTVVSENSITFKVPVGQNLNEVQTKNSDERDRIYAESKVFNFVSGK